MAATRELPAREAPGGPEIVLENPNRYPGLDMPGLRVWLTRLVAALAPDADSFAARLVGARAMKRLNQRFRQRPAPTDVLSFPGEPSPEGAHLGDVAVCYPLARIQAQRAGHDVRREVRLLLLHGVLHCLGYDHETDGGEMLRLERRLRRRWIDADE
ncbi:MAG: rRNA maturation RNase YbeY [Thermoanaerobaculia bacterium]|nr:rRNA maturation RNase YbeY [Thermoanaerobaculia bacterium]